MISIGTRLGLAALTAALAATMAAAALPATASEKEFAYAGDAGPGFWGELDDEWTKCSAPEGTRQSPIEITRATVDPALGRLELVTYPTAINLKNNGHTVQQTYENTGSQIHFEGVIYQLQQFHFHSIAEHRIGGRQAAMEMHAVYSNGASLLAVGQIFELGEANPFLQKLIAAGLPAKKGLTSAPSEVQINVADAWPNTRKYYTYPGSLTSPPCSETVTWVLFETPARMSAEQYEAFRSILGNNFRPLQPLKSRTVRAAPGGQGVR
jgi:carbonic anhydrase